jgi:membrane protein DedA with SNARE-associated domain
VHHTLQFLTQHGYSVVFASVLAQQIGLPVPAMVVLLAAGAVAGMGTLNFGACMAAAVIATVLGDLVWYILGRRYGSKFLGLLCRISLEPDSCVERTGNVYWKYGTLSLVFAKFVPGLSTVVMPLAGKFKLPASRFLLFDTLGAMLWTATYMAIGWLFRSQLERVGEWLQRLGAWLALLALVAFALYLALRYYRRRVIYRDLRMSRIAPWELKERMDSGQDFMLLDLRNPLEWNQGIIPGATPIAADALATLAAQLVDKSEVVLYCS